MTHQKTMAELESLGTDQNRKVYPRHGVSTPLFGVSFGNLKKVKKKLKKNHALALSLWDTRNHDARILAAMIADAEQMQDDTLAHWMQDLDNYIVSDAVSNFLTLAPNVQALMEKFILSDDEWIGRTGWMLLAHISMKNKDLPDRYFEKHINHITEHIHQAKNKTRDAMNNALIAMGIRNEYLQEAALEAAAMIGKVEVDHGQTSCKTPDAAGYIKKTVARKRKKVMGVKK